jgi:amino acid transporter/nucleotide-binding universal stress UspA family protein
MSENSSSPNPLLGLGVRINRPIQVLVVSSVMFTFISYWRTAAVVLCDLASTAYYIGGIVEGAIGPAAPWFILGVMIFSYAVRSIYIESCSLFVRGGVYRVVKESMGGFLAKLSVSALMFDYILTGPTSSVSAGQYIIGLLLDTISTLHPAWTLDHDTADYLRRWSSVVIACAITIYFFLQNRRGIHESSGKALKIMIATTVMVVVMLIWCGITLAVRGGPVNGVPTMRPDLSPKVEHEVVRGKDRITGVEKPMWKRDAETGKLAPEMIPDPHAPGKFIAKPKPNEATGRQEDPLGFIARWFPNFAESLRAPGSWWSILGMIGIMIAFGHSVLAMSGEETLAQVYREVESPKMPNFKKAAFIVFIYSLAFTATISFLAVLLIPDEVRMKDYSGNLIGGLAMYVVGPSFVRLLLNAFVVVIGFLILSGGVNTSIIGSNGVLNRVAEDGVMPDWFLKPHRRYGTTHRVLYLIVILQLAVILLSRGNMYTLGEAYAFGVVWSFVFNAMAMVVLRFKDRSPREFKVPLNLRIRGVEVPVGLCIIFMILLFTAVFNVLTKEVATIGGLIFTCIFFSIFWFSERYHEKLRGSAAHKHLEQFNESAADELAPAALGLNKPYRKLVAIRSTQNLYMLEKTLAETDPFTTDVVVMTAQVAPRGDGSLGGPDLDHYNRELMTAVVNRAEKAGKHVQPLIVRTNNPLYSVVQTAKELQAQELVLGVSNIYNADDQIEQIAFYWISLFGGETEPLTVRLLSQSRDLYFDLAGGNRIPKIGERQARSVAELREAGVGVSHVLVVHYGNSASSDLFTAALTMLDPLVAFSVVRVPLEAEEASETDWFELDLRRARQLNREVEVYPLSEGDPNEHVVELARRLECGLVVIGQLEETDDPGRQGLDFHRVAKNSPCSVCLVAAPSIPQEVAE